MKTIKAKETFSIDGIIYEKGDEVNVNNVELLVKLNEKGFIEPLKAKDIQNFAKELEPKKVNKEE